MKICYFLVPKNNPQNLTFGSTFGGTPPPGKGSKNGPPFYMISGTNLGA